MSEQNAGADSGGDSGDEGARAPSSLAGALVGSAWKLATRGPRKALDLAQKGLTEAERVALSTLRKRMDAVADSDSPSAEHGDEETATPKPRQGSASPATASAPLTAATAMARLLDTALEQSQDSAREALLLRTVRQLVPDEARILAALADGHASALMHLGAGPMVGPATQRWLENLSPVGKEAGVQLIDQTSAYVTHLRELGLLESGDEDKSLQLKYQLMEGDTKVRKTAEEIEKSGLRPKFFRRTIRMSEAGKAFWAACEPKERQSW